MVRVLVFVDFANLFPKNYRHIIPPTDFKGMSKHCNGQTKFHLLDGFIRP